MEQREQNTEERHGLAMPVIGAAISIAGLLATKAIQARHQKGSSLERIKRRSKLNYRSAAEEALRFVHGDPIQVVLSEDNGKGVWEVGILPEGGGDVTVVRIDAKSGNVLECLPEMPGSHPHQGHIPCGHTEYQKPFRHPISEP